jgi:hypothetical protein
VKALIRRCSNRYRSYICTDEIPHSQPQGLRRQVGSVYIVAVVAGVAGWLLAMAMLRRTKVSPAMLLLPFAFTLAPSVAGVLQFLLHPTLALSLLCAVLALAFCAFVCALLAIGMNSVTRIHDVDHAMPNAAS